MFYLKQGFFSNTVNFKTSRVTYRTFTHGNGVYGAEKNKNIEDLEQKIRNKEKQLTPPYSKVV